MTISSAYVLLNNMSLAELASNMSTVTQADIARGMVAGLSEVVPIARDRFHREADSLVFTLRAKQYQLTHMSRLPRPGGIGQYVPRDHHSSRHIGR